MTEHKPTLVRIDHENYIPIPKHRLIRALSDSLQDGQRREFGEFCRILDSIYQHRHHELSRGLAEDYELFNSVKRRGEPQPDWNTTADCAELEDRFLQGFFRLMKKANFALLSQEDVELADEEDYLFTLPVEINWAHHDTELLSRFLGKHPELLKDLRLPEYVDKILLFRRGTGVDRTEGLFLIQKLDILLSKLVLGLIGKVRRQIEPPSPSPVETASPESSPTERTTIFAERFIERKSLNNSRWKLWQKTQLQEPTFQQLVVLFRFKTPPAKLGQPAPPPDRTIHLKLFRDIPMADLEVVFPEKKLSMQPKDLVSLVITGAIGLGVTLHKLIFAAALNPVLALVTLVSLGGYALKVALGYKNSKDRYQSLVTNTLYDKSLDNAAGVIFTLVEAMKDQEFLETVLAYYFLWKHGPMTTEQLDQTCEAFIQQTFQIELDFEVPDALGKVEQLGLAVRNGDQYQAASISDALFKLREHWNRAIVTGTEYA